MILKFQTHIVYTSACLVDHIMTRITLGIALVMTAAVLGCTAIPEGLKPVTGFEADRYLGKWHEIARLNDMPDD
jgi:hypothetical protein